ncbi:MAG TPA: hypothetical protein DCG12_20610 [Planctomycetaceae bacterium]|nr:hypothetical protein [Planctomycetaceae bacterium]
MAKINENRAPSRAVQRRRNADSFGQACKINSAFARLLNWLAPNALSGPNCVLLIGIANPAN